MYGRFKLLSSRIREIKSLSSGDGDIGYTDIQEDNYVIETPYSWFTTLHEFVHIILTEAEFEDDERMAYVIPAGIFYFYKYYGGKLVTT